MHFEIIETYPLELFDSALDSVRLTIRQGDGKDKCEEAIKIFIKNDEEGNETPEIIDSVLNFCENALTLGKREEKAATLEIKVKKCELNTFVRTKFKKVPDFVKLFIHKDDPNIVNLIFPRCSSSLSDIRMKLSISAFYFIFSALINIRNYIDYNTLSFSSPLKKQILRFKARIDKLFDELIVSDFFKGNYECRLARASDTIRNADRTVYEAIRNGSAYYGVKSYSMFTVNNYTFMIVEHSDFGEISLFEYEFRSKIYYIDF